MDIQLLVADYGMAALFAISFVAATIIPLSSEAALLAGIAVGVPVVDSLLACSVGNCLGCAVNYYLGAALSDKMQHKLEQTRSGRATLNWMQRYGVWSLFGSWLPFVGDPLTIVAGLARVRWWLFAAVVFPLRVARYVVLLVFV